MLKSMVYDLRKCSSCLRHHNFYSFSIWWWTRGRGKQRGRMQEGSRYNICDWTLRAWEPSLSCSRTWSESSQTDHPWISAACSVLSSHLWCRWKYVSALRSFLSAPLRDARSPLPASHDHKCFPVGDEDNPCFLGRTYLSARLITSHHIS